MCRCVVRSIDRSVEPHLHALFKRPWLHVFLCCYYDCSYSSGGGYGTGSLVGAGGAGLVGGYLLGNALGTWLSGFFVEQAPVLEL